MIPSITLLLSSEGFVSPSSSSSLMCVEQVKALTGLVKIACSNLQVAASVSYSYHPLSSYFRISSSSSSLPSFSTPFSCSCCCCDLAVLLPSSLSIIFSSNCVLRIIHSLNKKLPSTFLLRAPQAPGDFCGTAV
eukprot:766527-Hanusia_phi.AAC.7